MEKWNLKQSAYFFSFVFVCKVPEINKYWARKPFEFSVHFYCSSLMSRERYQSIVQFLKFSQEK